jgi:chemotaxis protein MotB
MRSLVLLTAALVGLGCVGQGTYDALRADHDQLLAEHQRGQQELEQTMQTLRAEQAEARELGQRLARLEAQLGATMRDKSSLEENIGQMQVALADLKRRKAEADARIDEFKALVARFKTLIDAGKLRVRIRDGRMVVELATDVLFPSGSARLSRAGQASIAEVATLLASIPERQFQVEGHTDNVPTGPGGWNSNWELASARALTVLRTMVDAGLPPDRISAASFGEARPSRANDTPENKAANRRIEIVVVPDLSSLPGFEELQRVSGPAAP